MSTSSSVRWASMLAATLGFCRCLGIIPGVIPRQPDAAPERGFIVAVLAQGVDPSSELAELRELAPRALAEPVGALVQHAAALPIEPTSERASWRSSISSTPL